MSKRESSEVDSNCPCFCDLKADILFKEHSKLVYSIETFKRMHGIHAVKVFKLYKVSFVYKDPMVHMYCYVSSSIVLF